MPGLDATYVPPEQEDLYPVTEEAYDRLLTWTKQAFQAAESARQPFEDRWKRAYKLYNSYVQKREGNWRSQVFMPEVFQNIETILPRLVAQLPKFLVHPVGPEDMTNSKTMETLLNWAAKSSGLYMELVKVFKDSLMYGTGILKTYHDQRFAYSRRMVPDFVTISELVAQPVNDPDTGAPLRDPDGNPVINETPITREVPNGYVSERQRYIRYDGPAAEAIDLFNFWVAPEATDIDSARFVIHRVYREISHIKRLVAEGIYRWPDNLGEDEVFAGDPDPQRERLDSIDLGPGNDPTRKMGELLEFHVDDGPDSPGRVITVLNRKAILRVVENTFDHGQKPFVRFVDYFQQHQFWGKGEIEAIEHLQDLVNALVNQRIDNVRLAMDKGWIVNTHQLEDPRQLRRRPGGAIEIKGDGMRPEDVISEWQVSDVTGSAFAEVEQARRMIEETTGVTNYAKGQDSPSMADTATGTAILQEQSGSRFGLKSRLAELDGLKRLAEHFGSILQQFSAQERVIRLVGESGAAMFSPFDPMSFMGAFDYDIETASIQQSETVRRQQKLDVFQITVQAAASGVVSPISALFAYRDLLEAMGVKNAAERAVPPPELMQQLMQQQQVGGMGQLPMEGLPDNPTAQPGLPDNSQPTTNLTAPPIA